MLRNSREGLSYSTVQKSAQFLLAGWSPECRQGPIGKIQMLYIGDEEESMMITMYY